MQITWNESMSTGVTRLDIQHKQLIQKFNEFTEILEQPTLAREAAGEVLDFLQFYATWHFSQEEDCMSQYKCPVAGANKRAHQEFVAMFTKFYNDWQDSTLNVEAVKETHTKLFDWIMNHIVKVDTRLRPCIKPE